MRIVEAPDVFHAPLTTKKVLSAQPFELQLRLRANAPLAAFPVQCRAYSLSEPEAESLPTWTPAEHRRRDEVCE